MTEIIVRLNQISNAWFNIIALNSLHLIVLFVLLFGITVLFRKKSAVFLYSVWSLFLLKAILLPVIHLPFLQRPVIPVIPLNAIVANSTQILSAPETGAAETVTIQSVLFLFWAAGILTLLIMYVRNEHLFFLSLKNSTHFPDQNKLQQLVVQLEIRNPVELRLSPNVPAPFTKGFRKPVIYLPQSALNWNENQLNHVLCHELAHIQRKDILVITIQNILNVLYFFHPLVWIANHQLNFQREKICDDTAIAILNENPARYGRTLMDNLESFLVHRRLPLIANGLFFSKKTIIKRFEYLLNRGKEITMKLNVFQKVLISTFILAIFILSCSDESDQNIFSSKEDISAEQIEYDEIPVPIGGKEAFLDKIVYSEKLKSLEGEYPLLVYALVNKNGKVVKSKIEVSSGYRDFDNAALNAVKTTKFTPAKLDNKDISMPIYIPVIFKDGEVRFGNLFVKIIKTDPNVKFIPYDSPPSPIGGFEAIQKNVIYPEADREAGHEGTVIVQAFVDKNGNVSDTTAILKSPGFQGLENAAIEALKKTKFKPAMQEEKPVGVYITIPVIFKFEKDNDR